MLKHKMLTILFFSLSLLVTACEKDPLSTKGQVHYTEKAKNKEQVAKAEQTNSTEKKITEKSSDPAAMQIGWEDLVPAEWRPDQTLVDKYNSGEIGDDDPRIMALKDRLREMEKRAPVNDELDGKLIKMPGLVVPVELDGEKVREFLLVPYHGACVHVPPPPSNQVVYVKLPAQQIRKLEQFETVWVTGLLSVEKTRSKLAESGYSLEATKVELYE